MKRSRRKVPLPSAVQADIEQCALEQFQFLVDERGFRTEPVGRARSGYSTITYLGDRIGFEIYIEFFASTVSVSLINIAELSAPHIPAPFAQKERESWRPFLGLNFKTLGVVRETVVSKPRLKRSLLGALHNTLETVYIDPRIEAAYRLGNAKVPWEPQVFKDILAFDAELVQDYLAALIALPADALFPTQLPAWR